MTTDLETQPAAAAAMPAVDAVQETMGVNGTYDLKALNGTTVTNGTTANGVHKSDKTSFPEHPLGPLSAAEIQRSAALVRAAWPEGTAFQFKVITLLEPSKADLVPWLVAERAGSTRAAIDRRAFVVYYLKNTVSTLFHS